MSDDVAKAGHHHQAIGQRSIEPTRFFQLAGRFTMVGGSPEVGLRAGGEGEIDDDLYGLPDRVRFA